MTPLHKAALNYARQGLPVFPIVPNGKAPLIPGGFKAAEIDEDVINAWWEKWPDANIGLEPEAAGWFVVDLDMKGGHNGIGNFNRLADTLSWPTFTYTVDTPTGGRHLYYAGSGPSTANKLGAGVDTRGVGGYVLLPPSVVDGRSYRVALDVNLAEVPAGVLDRLGPAAHAVGSTLVELDGAGDVARARRYLADLRNRKDVAVSGSGGNDFTYRTCCWVLNLGLSPEKVVELMLEPGGWNDACVPPWSRDELLVIATNANHYAQNGAGAWGVGAGRTFPVGGRYSGRTYLGRAAAGPFEFRYACDPKVFDVQLAGPRATAPATTAGVVDTGRNPAIPKCRHTRAQSIPKIILLARYLARRRDRRYQLPGGTSAAVWADLLWRPRRPT